MNMPFYVSPEQMMKDRADYARKGIGRGRSVAVLQYADGVVFVSENPSKALHKISEIYDRIAFAAVGRYNEFENLRIAGVRLADMRGYSYDRRDVTGRGLANAYAQTLGAIFSSGAEKPYEVEIFVAEVGSTPELDQVFRLTYDGQVADEQGYAAMGGQAESVTSYLAERWTSGLSLTDAIRLAVSALGHGEAGDRAIPLSDLEVAVLDRTRTQQRKFRRIGDAALGELVTPPDGPGDGPDPGSGGGAGPTGPDPLSPSPEAVGVSAPQVPPVPVEPVSPDPEPTAPEPVAPDPEPAAPEPVFPDPEPAAPEPVAPDPEPAAPEPVFPDPEPTAPEPVVPDPEPAPADPVEDLWPPVAPPPAPRSDRPPPPPGVAPTSPVSPAGTDEQAAGQATSDQPTELLEGFDLYAPTAPDGIQDVPDVADAGEEDVEREWTQPASDDDTPTDTLAEDDKAEEPGEDRGDGDGWHPFWRREDS